MEHPKLISNDFSSSTQTQMDRIRREAGPYLKWLLGVAKIASPIGIVVLAVYYFKLNVTPDISIGQGAFVAVQAGIMSAVLIGLFAVVFSAPAWIYHALGVRPHLLPVRSRKAAIRAVVKRSFLTQLTTFGAAMAIAYWPSRGAVGQDLIGPISALVALVSAVVLSKSARTFTSDGVESKGTFICTIALGIVAAFYSITLVWLLQKSGDGSPGKEFRFFLALAVLTVLTPAHLAFGIHEIKAQLATAFVCLLEVVIILGSPTTPVSMVASVIGIAEKSPVGIVVSEDQCRAFLLANAFKVTACNKGGPTLIGPVRILNSLGARWLILDSSTSKAFNIPGKDVIVVRDPAMSQSN